MVVGEEEEEQLEKRRSDVVGRRITCVAINSLK